METTFTDDCDSCFSEGVKIFADKWNIVKKIFPKWEIFQLIVMNFFEIHHVCIFLLFFLHLFVKYQYFF